MFSKKKKKKKKKTACKNLTTKMRITESEVKTESMTNVNYILLIILERSYLVQIHTSVSAVSACVFCT